MALLSILGVLLLLSVPEAGTRHHSPDPGGQSDTAAAAAAPSTQAEVAALIQAHVAAAADQRETAPHARAAAAELRRLYDAASYGPLWVDAAGRPTGNVHGALRALATAAADGLDPGAYPTERLGALASRLDGGGPARPLEVARFDLAMSTAMLRYFRHVHIGRIDPRSIGFRLVVPDERHDFPLLLRSALATSRIRETADDLAPPLAQYRALRSMLARYRALAAAAQPDLLAPSTAVLRPGDPYMGLTELHRRLVALGDLPADTPPPSADAPYAGTLVEGVKRFQARHALAVDGVIGRATLAALQVPLPWRVRQIELALERLRWLPDLGDEPLIALNIPMFHLWAWESRPTGAPSLDMRAIVGRALSTRTPVMVKEMRYVVFRPYWNVPQSILRNEILPVLARDLDYLRRHDMELVHGAGDDAQPVAATAESVARLRQGALRVRQRPGPRNALGLVKFVFPNDSDVYMHGTPAQELFGRARRDYSHGCVRLEDPVTLAEWVLSDQPAWSRERILAAMSGATPQRVNLTQPIRVILYYVTAVVTPGDGAIHFADDIYRHDVRLDRALTYTHPDR